MAKESDNLRLFMVLLGCKPPGRFTEQHDIFFGIATGLAALVPDMIAGWPEAPVLHIDAWREVTLVNGYRIEVADRTACPNTNSTKLFFLNLGGYKQGEFEEYHYKLLAVAPDKAQAIGQAKQTAFYKHTGFSGAQSHIDDKYGVDVDDLYEIADILPTAMKERYTLTICEAIDHDPDEWHIGYTKLSSLTGRT